MKKNFRYSFELLFKELSILGTKNLYFKIFTKQTNKYKLLNHLTIVLILGMI